MRLRFVLSETAKGISRNLAMTVSVVLVAFVSLLFVGASSLLQSQISTMKGDWYDKVEVSVYMCPKASASPNCADGEATAAQISEVENLITSGAPSGYVKSYQMETKAQAYKNFMKAYAKSAVGRNATEDMMPVSFRIKLKDAENYKLVAEQFEGHSGVERVVDQRSTLEPLFLVMNRASWITGGLATIMAVAAVLLISTTIRLSAMSRSRQTGIMRLAGSALRRGGVARLLDLLHQRLHQYQGRPLPIALAHSGGHRPGRDLLRLLLVQVHEDLISHAVSSVPASLTPPRRDLRPRCHQSRLLLLRGHLLGRRARRRRCETG